MKRILRHLAPIVIISAAACGRSEPEMDLAAYEAEVLEWRAGRLERLLDPNGYLTQVGLRWLDEGTYSIGSDPGNDIVIPATAAARCGLPLMAFCSLSRRALRCCTTVSRLVRSLWELIPAKTR
jgi:hypothetical protein